MGLFIQYLHVCPPLILIVPLCVADRDAANLLKPALARGQFRCIGATTLAEYREHIEKDGALERRFAPVRHSSDLVCLAVASLGD